jgi:nucleoside 2-deoxyribosyltransferase
MSTIYLAARYSRRLELVDYRSQLRALGYEIPARWLDGGHQLANDGTPIGETGEALVESDSVDAAALRAKFAMDDFEDVRSSDIVVAFTEQPRSGNSRGGRHVELGIALGEGIPVMIVGPRENVFCWLPHVRHFESWSDCLKVLAASRARLA